jgi:uncharacterized repeat protein (TIGR02543 family)
MIKKNAFSEKRKGEILMKKMEGLLLGLLISGSVALALTGCGVKTAVSSSSQEASVTLSSEQVTTSEAQVYYTVSFENYDLSPLGSAKVLKGGTAAYTGEKPTRAKTAQYTYDFSGWDGSLENIQADCVRIAQYAQTLNEYTVKFVNDDGTTLDTETVKYGSAAVYNGTTPTKAADAQYTYAFSGWDVDYSNIVGDLTVKAVFSHSTNAYVVDFQMNGGSSVQSQTLDYGMKVTKPADPTKTGYTFAGWYKDSAFAEAFDFDNEKVEGNVSVYAKWTINSYTVTFVNYDGTTVLDTETVNYGSAAPYKGQTPTKPADVQYTYTFSGWDVDFSNVPGNLTVTAQFSKTLNEYKVAFDSEGGSEVAEQTIAYGSAVVKPADPTKTGYTFSGWYKDSSLTEAWDFTADTVTGNASVYAKWTINSYTVTFVSDDGTTVLDTETVNYGSAATYNGQNPTKAADAQYTYAFSAWDVDYSHITGNLTVTAQFSHTLNEYGVSFESNGGSEVTAQTVPYGNTVTKPADPTKTGYTFAGWYKDSALAEAWDFTADTVTGNASVYAKWTINSYTVTFVDYDGTTVLDTETVDYQSDATYNGTAPTRAATTDYAYYFSNWDVSYSNITSDLTVTAVYTRGTAGITYTLSSDGSYYCVSGYTGTNTNIEFPSVYNGKPVTRINQYAFGDNKKITSVNIPETITTVYYGAFSYCKGITYMYINSPALNTNCIENLFTTTPTWLKTVVYGEKVTKISNDACYKCTGLTSVTISDSVTSIGSNAFFNCSSLTSFKITAKVSTIGAKAFSGCTALTSLTVDSANPNFTMTNGMLMNKAGTVLISYLLHSTSVVIPSTVTTISESAFASCGSLTSVTIPSSVTSIGKTAFQDCTNLTSITIPSGVTLIDSNTFKGCSKLVTVTLPSTITKIGDYAFQNCTSLATINIPSGLTSFGPSPFYGCTALASFTVDAASQSFKAVEGVLMSFDGTTLFFYPNAKGASYVIPSTVTSIGNYAFDKCTSLTAVTIPSTVTSIGINAFESCTGLTSVIIHSTTMIGNASFNGDTCVIYAEATSLPSGWNSYWNYNYTGKYYWYSETTATGCWHYVSGVPTLW